MKTLGIKEAAHAIKDRVEHDLAARVDPDKAHEHAFIKGVTEELGLDSSHPENLNHVATVLRESGIAWHARQEYPKWVTGPDGTNVIVDDADQEQAVRNSYTPVDGAGFDSTGQFVKR